MIPHIGSLRSPGPPRRRGCFLNSGYPRPTAATRRRLRRGRRRGWLDDRGLLDRDRDRGRRGRAGGGRREGGGGGRGALATTLAAAPATPRGGSTTLLMLARSSTDPCTSMKSGSMLIAVIR